MLEVTDIEIKNRMYFDNPWWDDPSISPTEYKQRRIYYDPLYKLVTDHSLRRAAVLMGPRRVGKTVILRQLMDQLIEEGVDPKSIIYVSLDNPVYQGLGLSELLELFRNEFDHKRDATLFAVFDEIQYLKDWERHLKVLVDDEYSKTRLVVSGSAAAALKRKSQESGAGRFTDLLLPPLTFFEYCQFKNYRLNKGWRTNELNHLFVDYVNYGGFPEIVFDSKKKSSLSQHLGQDIIERVLLRDLPSLYGISDPVELNRLFRVLALNTGQEISLEKLSQKSNVSKNTLKSYLAFLEAAFLIFRIDRVDQNARIFKRATHFKIYLTNPSMRTALFGPLPENHEQFGSLVETAYFAQRLQVSAGIFDFYARWNKEGAEVDHISLAPGSYRPKEAYEIKWSDRIIEHLDELKGLTQFVTSNKEFEEGFAHAYLLTKSNFGSFSIKNAKVSVSPIAVMSYVLGNLQSNYLHGTNGFEHGMHLANKDAYKHILKANIEKRAE